MNKEQMIDEVIRQYGFENKWTIWFCELAEVLTESQLLNAFIVLKAGVELESEEEDELQSFRSAWHFTENKENQRPTEKVGCTRRTKRRKED